MKVKIHNNLFATIDGISHRESLELRTAITRREQYTQKHKHKNRLFYEILSSLDKDIKNTALNYGHFITTCEGCECYFVLDKDPLGPFVCSEQCAVNFIEKYP